MNNIKEYYNYAYDEWGRLERHRIEYEITKKALNEYIPNSSKILDVGGGPGRYSIFLAQKDHKVTLFDLSETLVEQAKENALKAGVIIQDYINGNVLNLGKILPDKYFDVVMCMGPMYHLLEDEERKEAVRQCLNRLKPGGIFIASFISAYAPIIDLMKSEPLKIKGQMRRLLNYLDDGRNYKVNGFTDAYFINPDNIEVLFSEFKLNTLRILAAEGLGAVCEGSLMQLPEQEFQEWIDLFYEIADKKVIWGSCEHFLYIGRKIE